MTHEMIWEREGCHGHTAAVYAWGDDRLTVEVCERFSGAGCVISRDDAASLYEALGRALKVAA